MNRAIQVSVLAIMTVALSACVAGRQKSVGPPRATQPPIAKPDDRYGYRFYMTQNGKRMTADDFDAWLKAKGLRLPGGKPGTATAASAKDAKGAKARATADGRRSGGARLAGASTRPEAAKGGGPGGGAEPAKGGGAARSAGSAKGAEAAKVTQAGKAKARQKKTATAATATAARDG